MFTVLGCSNGSNSTAKKASKKMTAATLPLDLNRRDAFHLLGTDVSTAKTAKQALQGAGLAGWNVRKTPLTTNATVNIGGEEMAFELDVPGQFASTYTNPETGMPEVLGVVGNTYVPIQNEAHADLLDAIVDESGAHFESAAKMRGGRDVFVTMKLNSQMLVGGVDPVDLYLAAFNSHDGQSSFKLAITNTRVFCSNQQAAVMRDAKSKFSIRHTAGSGSLITEAREALKLTFAYNAQFEAAAEKMIQTTMTDAAFAELVKDFWDVPEDAAKAVQTRDANRREQLEWLFADASTNDNIRGTAWAAYQSFTEYVDHYAPTVLGKSDSIESARALRVLTGATAFDVKNLAFQKIMATV
ncbi:hypothetical protein FDI41_gp73 [Arthrobacter phage Piccoletto]|uniref:DUF945 domain-containing protein n=1 Tax=Arthrobacter phage Piccoletto TaxID=2024282 RepID=A0A222Z985_9CAUD|nr:hypothetical protein FDI41_gp73 [Arthrobacter phage Piccoletto]ASR80703.1 hypothetical protein SEA_PICCOLETTO_73 [Arthrobacter phage Piccoletto]